MKHPTKPPSLTDMAKNLVGELAEWTLRGFPTPDEDELKQRLETCAACPHWDAQAVAGHGRCLKCGCSRAKLFLKTAKCPIGKW